MAITTSSTTVQSFGDEYFRNVPQEQRLDGKTWSYIPYCNLCYVAIARKGNDVIVVGAFSEMMTAQREWGVSGWPQRGYSLHVSQIACDQMMKCAE